MSKRVLLAGLFHETHTFLTERTGLSEFTTVVGPDILALEGTGSPLAGFLEIARVNGWDVLPTIDMRAMPGGTVQEAVVDYFWTEFSARAKAALMRGVDAIFLVLHGAMVSEHILDVEGEMLERIRGLPGAGTLPIFGVLDLHANVSARMLRLADCLVAYRENPHADAYDTGCRAARLLSRCFSTGIRPRAVLHQPPIVWAPPGTGTAADPMQTLTSLAAKVEAEDTAVWAVNIGAGFSFADTPDTGVSVAVIGEGPAARHAADAAAIAAKAWELRGHGEIRYPEVNEVLARILPVVAGPVLLVEPSDNVGGGAPGDGTGVLRALLKFDVPESLVVLNDSESVRRAATVPIGGDATLAIGGKGSSLDPGPVVLPVTIVSRSNGSFDLEDVYSHLASMLGRHVEMGDCAVVRHRGITVLLTSRKTPPFDLGQLRSQGIEPTRMKVIGVKAAVAHRRAYDPIAQASHLVETPGPCSSDLSRFSFRHLRRPIFPLDRDAAMEPAPASDHSSHENRISARS